MIFDNAFIDRRIIDSMPKTPVTIIKEIGYTYDSVTNKRKPTISQVNIFAYVGTFDNNLIERDSNNLTQESRRVIIPADIEISMDDKVKIDGVNHRIVWLRKTQTHITLGVNAM